MKQIKITDAGPFGEFAGNKSYKYTENYEQFQWLKQALADVDRKKTPCVLVTAHRPIYSTQTNMTYQVNMQKTGEQLLIDNAVDVFVAG